MASEGGWARMPGDEAGGGDAERVLALVRRFGQRPTSFQVLNAGFHYWFADAEAAIAYTDTGHAWVAAGMPLAARERFPALVRAFGRAARSQRRRVQFFGVDAAFAAEVGLNDLFIGELPVWDPGRWATIVRSSRSLREQLRRAAAKGVRIRQVPWAEIATEPSPVRRAMDQLVRQWLTNRRAAPMAFLVGVQPFHFGAERRYFAAELDGRLVAFLVAVPVYARKGWLIETVFRNRETPNGVSEQLIDAAMRTFAAEGSTFATLGLVPLTGDIHHWLKLASKLTVPLYNFAGLRSFKAKLRPETWEPVYIAYDQRSQALTALGDTLAAFTPRGRLRFAIASLVKRRQLVVGILACLLVPWTSILLLVATEPWFPTLAVQRAWVIFDIGLIVSLAWLARRWRPWLATLLALLTTLDAGLTLLQALVYNLPRARSLRDGLVIAIAVLAPTTASAFLWRARH